MFVYRVIILFLVFKWLFFLFNILTRAWTACCHTCSARLLDSTLMACSNPAESGRVPAYKASTSRTWTCTWAATNRVRWSASDPEPSSLSLAPRRFLHKNSKTHINLIHHTITRRRSGAGTPVTHSELILLLRFIIKWHVPSWVRTKKRNVKAVKEESSRRWRHIAWSGNGAS